MDRRLSRVRPFGISYAKFSKFHQFIQFVAPK